jgi:hypothetical protein
MQDATIKDTILENLFEKLTLLQCKYADELASATRTQARTHTHKSSRTLPYILRPS